MKNGSEMEQNNQEKKVKEKKGGFKKFLKITGFTMLGIVGIIGVAMGIALISGAYNKDKINILSLSTSTENLLVTNSPAVYIGDGSAEVVVMSGETLTATLSYTPDNANQKDLSVRYMHGKNLLANTPDKVVAGEKFSLKFKENVGGEVEIRFTNSTKLVSFTLKVLVDNVVTDADIELYSDASNGFRVVELPKEDQDIDTQALSNSHTDKRFVTARSADVVKYITLQGKTVSSVAPKRGAVVFNDSTISTLAYKTPYTIINTDENRLMLSSDQNSCVKNDDDTVDYKYAMRAMSSTTNAYISTYFPKTFAMQLEFNSEWLNKAVENNLENYDYAGLEAYINKYFDYIFPLPADVEDDKVQEYYDDLLADILVKNEETGLYEIIVDDGLEQSRLVEIMQNIFVYIKQDIVVYDVEIEKIDVQESLTYKLFSTSSYDNETVGYGDNTDYLGVTLISESRVDKDNSLLKEDIGKLIIAPYIKIVDDSELGEWEENTTIKVPADTITYDWQTSKDADQTLDVVISSGPKIVALDGNQYLKYVRIGDEWYKFNESKLQVNTSYTIEGYKKMSTWSLKALNPTISTDNLALIYSIESVNEDGESNWIFAKSDININYTRPNSFGYNQNDEIKMIYHYTPKDATAQLSNLQNTTGYKINSVTLNVSDVVSQANLTDLEYKAVRFFMVKATNTFTYNNIDYNVFDIDPSWKTCKLSTIDGTQITVDSYDEFYDLGSNPTLNILNITSLNSNDAANKVKIFACLLQSDIDGNLVVDITYDKEDEESNAGQNETSRVEVSREYKVAYYSNTNDNVNTNNITIDHFASKLFAYVKVGDEYVIASSSSIQNISTDDTLTVYISTYELSADGSVDDNIVDSVDSDGICLTYLNIKALANYYALSNGYLKNNITFAEGMPAFTNLEISEIVNPITNSDITLSDTYITLVLSFNNLSERITNGDLTINEVTYANEDRPLEFDFMIYIVPDGELGTSTPYYVVTGFDASCKAHIKLVQGGTNPVPDTGKTDPSGGGEAPVTGPDNLV